MSTSRRIVFMISMPLLAGLASCADLVVACPNPGSFWEVSPPELDLAVGQAVQVSVVEITCAGRRRVAVYPDMIVSDTAVAVTDTYYRHVRGRAPGSTKLTLIGHDVREFRRDVPVTVR